MDHFTSSKQNKARTIAKLIAILLCLPVAGTSCERVQTRQGTNNAAPEQVDQPQVKDGKDNLDLGTPGDKSAEPSNLKPAEFAIEVEKPDKVLSLLVHPSADKHGRKPQEVVIAFVDDVAVGDRDGARAWWYDNPNPHRMDKPLGFEAYFNKLRAADRILIGPTGKSKGQYYAVRISVYQNGKDAWGSFYQLEKINNEWKILRSILW